VKQQQPDHLCVIYDEHVVQKTEQMDKQKDGRRKNKSLEISTAREVPPP
jgi:cation transport regulator ChaB